MDTFSPSPSVLLALLFFVFLQTVCCKNYDELFERKVLATNQTLWLSTAGPNASYSMEFFRNCFCPPEYVGPFLVVVETGLVVSATYFDGLQVTNPAIKYIISVDEAFQVVQNALDDGFDELVVEYDSLLGFPSYVWANENMRIADAQDSFAITNVVL